MKGERKRLTVNLGFRFHLEDQRRFALGFHYLEREELTKGKRHYEIVKGERETKGVDVKLYWDKNQA